jgi:hypothetical protein
MRIGNKLYHLVLNVYNINRVEWQGVNSIVLTVTQVRCIKCNNSNGRPRGYIDIN